MKILLLFVLLISSASAEVYNSGTIIRYTDGSYMVIPNISTKTAPVDRAGNTIKYTDGSYSTSGVIIRPKAPSIIKGK